MMTRAVDLDHIVTMTAMVLTTDTVMTRAVDLDHNVTMTAMVLTTDAGMMTRAVDLDHNVTMTAMVLTTDTVMTRAVDLENTVTRDTMADQVEMVKNVERKNHKSVLIKGRHKGTYRVRSDGRMNLATENLVPGNTVYKERLVEKNGVEYRTWDPFRSKLAASIENGLETFPFMDGSSILYLGVSSGTTASHISDILGSKGRMFCVEHASRVARDFLDRVASYRSNIVPVLQDARRPSEYFAVYGKVDIVYADIAQPDQTQIVLENCQMYLKEGVYCF
ncbi:MAG: Fibrillarin [Cenarchaeum symbiont of Oopsacas minuta]|nr:Fibrillarin [Cenarchaeum symbiont of Oopsacas minuta]